MNTQRALLNEVFISSSISLDLERTFDWFKFITKKPVHRCNCCQMLTFVSTVEC